MCNTTNKVCYEFTAADFNNGFNAYSTCLLQCNPEEVMWPQPKKIISHSNKLIQLHEAKIEIILNETDSLIKIFLKKIVSLFMIKIKSKCPFGCSRNNSRHFQIALQCESSDLNLRWHTNESYALKISDTGLIFIFFEKP